MGRRTKVLRRTRCRPPRKREAGHRSEQRDGCGTAARRALEIWALGAATLLALLSAWYACRLSWVSYQLHDVSTGNDATPLWIPQLTMALGNAILLLAFVDELVLEWRGQRVAPVSEEATRNE